MYVFRNVPFEVIWRFGWKNVLAFLVYGIALTCLHSFLLEQFNFEMHLPFALIGPVGVAVAIYASFKNGQAYDRTWEARKNWGTIGSYSRIFARQVLNFLNGDTDARTLLYRQLAYLNAHKLQLRKRAPHSRTFNRSTQRFYFGEPSEEDWKREVANYMPADEYGGMATKSNRATQVLFLQGRHLHQLYDKGAISELKYLEALRSLDQCVDFQGRNERIKTTPFPRQYGFFSKSFVIIYVLILPFGILDLYEKFNLPTYMVVVLLYALVSWLYITIELVGTNSEDPFENFITDVPMSALCRGVEIDLLEMMDEKNVPPKIQEQGGVLM